MNLGGEARLQGCYLSIRDWLAPGSSLGVCWLKVGVGAEGARGGEPALVL